MKIWYISKYACPKKYNFGTRHFLFANEFNELGHETIVFTSNSNHLVHDLPQFKGLFKEEMIDGVKTIWINTPRYSKSKSLRRIWSWIIFELRLLRTAWLLGMRPDVIIASSLSLLTVVSGFLMKKIYKAKLVFEVRDIWPLTLKYISNVSPFHPLYFIFSKIEKFGYRRSDLVVGSMPGLYKHVFDTINLSKDVLYIPHGVDMSKVEIEEPNFLEYGVTCNNDDFIITYSGTVGTVNAIDYFIIAAKKISTINKKIIFLIIGDGELKSKYEQDCNNFNRIYFLPKMKKSLMLGFLKKSDVLYYGALKNDLYNFGISPNKLNDYLFAAKPILASYSGYDDLFEPIGCGLVVGAEDLTAIENGMLLLYSMPKNHLETMGKLGYEYLIKFRTSRSLAKLYLNSIQNA